MPPLEHLGGLLRRHPPVDVPGLPRFTGGAVGYLGYDIVRTIESLPDAPPDDRDLPDAVMMVTDTLLVLDNLYNRATVIANVEVDPEADDEELRRLYAAADARIDDWIGRLAGPGTVQPLAIDLPRTLPPAVSPYADERFQDDVRRIKEYIAAGDTFQTVLSRRLEVAAPDPFLTYRYLRALNPAPYLYYLHCDDIHVIGSSPEILVRVEDGEVTLRPIAGTRPRGATPEEDAALAAELTADPKERAEHLMLVDLGRNDVGRVAEYGSVRLTAFMTIERYSHVMHLVSEVRGRLRPELDAVAALAASFPGRHRLRRAQGAGHADHRRAGAGPPRTVRRRGRLHRLGRAARWTPPSRSAPASCGAAAPGCRPAPASWRTPIPPPNGGRRRPRRGRCCWRWRSRERRERLDSGKRTDED